MPAITLATFRSRVRSIGRYTSTVVITDAFLNEQINDAVGAYCDMLDATFEGYRDTVATASTVAGTATVSLPADFLKARAVDVLIGGQYRPLDLYAIGQTYGFSDRGEPRGYLVRGGVVELFPTPDAVYTLRFRYIPAASTLAQDGDSIEIPNGWEKWIIYSVLAVLDDGDERDTSPRLRVVEEVRQRVAAAAKTRNTAGPRYVPFPGEGCEVIP